MAEYPESDLSRVFSAWRDAHRRHQCRKNKIIAACRIGLRFWQRYMFYQWRAHCRKRSKHKYSVTDKHLLYRARSVNLGTTRRTCAETRLRRFLCTALHVIILGYAHYIQKKSFYLWKKFTKNAIARRNNLDLIAAQRQRLIIKNWKSRCDGTQTSALADREAFVFHCYQLTKRSIRGLKAHTHCSKISLQLHKTRVEITFERWRRKALLRQTFRFLRDRIIIEANARINGNIISKRARIWVLHDVFKTWRYLSSLKSHEKSLMQARDSATICHHLIVWKHAMRKIMARKKLLQARNSRLLCVVWNSLKMYTAEALKNDDLRRKSRRFRYFSLLYNGFTAFKHNKESLDQCVCRFQSKNRIGLQRSVFLFWKSFALHRRRLFEIKETIQSCNEKALLKRIWCSGLVKHHMQVQLYNRKVDAAIKHYEQNLLRKTLSAWFKWCQAQHTYMEALTHLARNHSVQKLIEKRNEYFSSWKEHTLHKVCTRHIAAYIRGRNEHRLARRYYSAWTTYIMTLRRKASMYQRAEKHQNRTFLLRYFTIWKCKCECRISSRNQLRSSLLHWKISLQRKTFHTWKAHVSIKMEERAGYHAALEFRHQYFIRQGLRLWFLAATGLQEQRLHDLEMVQAAHSMQIWRKVAFIARHWRNRTVRARVHMPATSVVPIKHFAISQEGSSQKRFNRKKPLKLPENHFTGTNIEYSELNEFPRERPRPRKPYDLLLKQEDHTFEEEKEGNCLNLSLEAESERKLSQRDKIGQEALISTSLDKLNWTKTPCIDELTSRLEYWMRRKRNLNELKKHVQAMTRQINCDLFAKSNFERKTRFLSLREALEKRITDEAKGLQGAKQEIQGLATAIALLREEMY